MAKPSIRAVALVAWATLGGSLCADTIVLKTGGRLEGEVLNPRRDASESLHLRTASGVQVSIPAAQIAKVLTLSDAHKEYDERLHKLPATAAAHFELAEWCRDAGLPTERRQHLEQTIQLDPDHEKARTALGFQKSKSGWATRDELMRRQGYVRSGGAWKLPQELEIEDSNQQAEFADRTWRKQLKVWFDQFGRKGEPNARAGIAEIRDPAAAAALADAVVDPEQPIVIRELCLEAIGKLPGGIVSAKLAQFYLKSVLDIETRLRDRCLDEIARDPPRSVVMLLIKALGDKENRTVNRAAQALSVIGDASATLPLIDALVTTHTQKIAGNPGQMSMSFGGGGPGGGGGLGGMSMGSPAKVLKATLENDSVLRALTRLHPGVNYGFREDDWRKWYIDSQTTTLTNLRRDE